MPESSSDEDDDQKPYNPHKIAALFLKNEDLPIKMPIKVEKKAPVEVKREMPVEQSVEPQIEIEKIEILPNADQPQIEIELPDHELSISDEQALAAVEELDMSLTELEEEATNQAIADSPFPFLTLKRAPLAPGIYEIDTKPDHKASLSQRPSTFDNEHGPSIKPGPKRGDKRLARDAL